MSQSKGRQLRRRKGTDLLRKRSPGLQGTYEGTCIVCLRPTDTACALKGDAEFIIAGLYKAGLPMKEAADTVSFVTGNPSGMVPRGELEFMARVCQKCANKAGLQVAVVYEGAAVPCYYEHDMVGLA